MMPELTHLKRRLADVQSLKAAAYLMYWDQSTLMPEQGAAIRGEQMAYIEKLAHEKATDPAIGELLTVLSREKSHAPVDADLIRVTQEDYQRNTRLPSEFVERYSSHAVQTYHLWKKAREARDFKMVVDALKKSVDLSREYSGYFQGFQHVADPLIDVSDPGSTVAELQPLFQKLRAQLVPLLNEITAHPPLDNSCLKQSFDPKKQIEFGEKVIRAIGYDFKRGRQDMTAHPFMIRFNTDDVRITTRVKEHDLGEALFSSIHEAGHALYELGIDPALEGTPLASGTSSGVHESQSRLWENLVGRSQAFWAHFYPELQATFPQQLKHVGLIEFHRAINRVQRDLIRTDADEVTYNLHVMIRFDLEIALLEGRLKVEDLRDAWNARYESDLGITPPHDGDGVLQDVHWFSGFVGGAFQGYTLGNIMSAQFFEAATRAIPDLEDRMSRGDFLSLREWLRTHLHHYGRRHTANEAMKHATGRPLEVEPYMRYLADKYRKLAHSVG